VIGVDTVKDSWDLGGKFADLERSIWPQVTQKDSQGLGDSEGAGSWSVSVSACRECGQKIEMGRGVICANAYVARGHWTACQAAWCGQCYKSSAEDQFVIKRPKDEEGYSRLIPKDKDRFLTARNGDHFMCQFQCDTCQFRNLLERDPDPLTFGTDGMMMRCVRRANLDAFWARESTTVEGTR
jgi:hypothetical protein